MVEKILNNTTPYGKIKASHGGSLHSSTLNGTFVFRNKENRIIFGPPSPHKSRRDTNGHEHGYTHTYLFIPAACDLDFY